MAISKLDFDRGRGQVVNPLDSIGDDLLKFGSSLHQREKDRLAALRQADADRRAQEQLDMQKQQYADQKEKEAAMQAFAANISKPRQLAESSALFKQVDADKAAFDKRMESVAYTEPENVYTSGTTDQATKDRLVASGLVNPAEVERKTKQQMDLAGMVLAPTDAMKETRTQQIERVMQEMASKGQPITTAVYQELDKARLADETAKTAKEKSLDELIKDSKKERIDMLKYGATALDKSRSGGVTVDDDGTLHYGGAAGTKALTSALDAEKKRIIGYQDAIASIPAAINKVTEKNKPTEDVRAAMTKSANELVDALVANKVDPKVASELVASQLSAGESGYLWGTLFGKDGSVKAINPDTMNSLIASGKKLSEIEQQKALVTAGGSVPKGSMAYELGVGLSRQADADLASLKAKKQVLDMTPEERQYAATKNRLDEILKPAAAEADKEIDATVSRPSKAGKGFTVDKYVNDQNSDAVAGSVKNIVDIAGNSFNNNGLKVAMGMTANEVMESGLNHKKVTPEETKSRGKFNSLGLYQMNGNHEKAFEKMFNKPILESSPEEQRKYVIDYLSKNPKIQEALSKAETAADAAEIITRTFEKPANIEERVAERRAVAEQVERTFNQSSNIPMEYKRATRGSTTILPADVPKINATNKNTVEVPVSNAGQYLRGELPAPDAPNFNGAKVSPDKKYSTGLLGWVEKQLPGVANGDIMQDVRNVADTVKQGGAAMLGSAARTGEFFSHILDPITMSISENFDRLATESEKAAKELLKKRGYSEEQAEKAVIMQELVAPGIPLSKITKSTKAAKIDADVLDTLRSFLTKPAKPADSVDEVVKLKKDIEPVVQAAGSKTREEVLEATTKQRVNNAKMEQRVEELSNKGTLNRIETLELERLKKLLGL